MLTVGYRIGEIYETGEDSQSASTKNHQRVLFDIEMRKTLDHLVLVLVLVLGPQHLSTQLSLNLNLARYSTILFPNIGVNLQPCH